VLDIVYARQATSVQIAETSIGEIRRLGVRDETKLARWDAAMRSTFPDVQPGSRLIGVYRPQRGAQFYSSTRLLGTIDDPEFSRFFFGIWLDPRTQKPDLRTALLGGSERAD
jgi:hypothetical protein